jgi:outer membrane protein assembly factor BamE (lipoprotein component of BamABCDE complex)
MVSHSTTHASLDKNYKEKVKLIEVGKTTKEDVIKLFGQPSSIEKLSDNTEVYTYKSHAKSSFEIFLLLDIENEKSQTLSIKFDQNGLASGITVEDIAR